MLTRLLILLCFITSSSFGQTALRLSAVTNTQGSIVDSTVFRYSPANNTGGDGNDYCNGRLKPDTAIFFSSWNNVYSPEWEMVYSYSPSGKVLSALYREYLDSSCYDHSITTYNYNENDSLTSKTLKGIDVSQYVIELDTYTYNGNRLSSHVYKYYVGPNPSDLYRADSTTYFYNGDTVYALTLYQYSYNSPWDTIASQTTVYDAAQNVTCAIKVSIEYLHRAFRYTTIYCPSGRAVYRSQEMRDTTGAPWHYTTRDTLMYNAAALLTVVYTDQMIDTGWQLFYSDTLIYDANNNLTDSINGRSWWHNYWNEMQRVTFTYNNANQVLTRHVSNTGEDATYYYSPIIDPNAQAPALEVRAYPSPAAGFVTISFAFATPVPFSVSIINTAGRQLKYWLEPATTSYTKTIPVNDLPPGNYRVFITDGKRKGSKAFAVMR